MDRNETEQALTQRVWQAALAGLLHDVGKFSQRAGVGTNVEFKGGEKREIGYKHAEDSATFVDEYVPVHLRREMQAVRYHHKPQNIPVEQQEMRLWAKIIHLADSFAAHERETGAELKSKPVDTGLVPILAKVELLHNVMTPEAWRYRVGKLELSDDALFPIPSEQEAAGEKVYAELWDEMGQELEAWKKSPAWNELSLEAYFVTLMAFLRKYLSYVPSATPWQADAEKRTLPDVSLYDHLKVTAALAACLRAGFDEKRLEEMTTAEERPVAVLVRGDWSGIQNFIFRITRAEGEGVYEKAAKRLRGRSFFLGLVGDVVVDWLTRQLGVTPANVLYSGGGRFDLLAPIGCEARVQELEHEINEWLLKQYYGELDVRMAFVEVKPSDLNNMQKVYDDVETILIERKQQKWLPDLNADFFEPKWEKYHACNVCHVTPLDEKDVCRECLQHLDIGKELPRTSHIALVQGQIENSQDAAVLWFDKFDLSVALCRRESISTLGGRLREKQLHGVIYRLNETNDFWTKDAAPFIGQSFRFLANSVPLARQDIHLQGTGPVNKGDTLHFGAIAACSTGAERIGILKADVDRLGLIFSLGIQSASISRVAALSGAVDLFFAGWLNRMCEKVFVEWREKQNERAAKRQEASALRNQVDGLFYVMYSGGDDLFVVGPWDATLELAKTLYADFTRYVCENPNITLSAGYVQVKPHYPVQRFAELVEGALKRAKNTKPNDDQEGRNQITAFGETVKWSGDGASFLSLYDLAGKLETQVEDKQIPRTLVHDLSRTEKIKSKATKEEKPLFSPRLYYALTRRLKEARRDELLKEDAIKNLEHFAFIANYVSLCTRKE